MRVVLLLQRLIQCRLFHRTAEPLGAWETFLWWELRRIPYNLIVGAVGIMTLSFLLGTAVISAAVVDEPTGMPDPFFGMVIVLAYATMANLCYTGGWVVELLVGRVWLERAGAFGEISFALGVAVSVLLTIAPIPLVGGLAAVSLVMHVLGGS